MSRQSVVIELAGGKSQRQRVWEAIRRFEHGGDDGPLPFTIEQLSRSSKVEQAPVRDYLKGLEAAGHIVRSDDVIANGRVKHAWTLARDNGVEAPRVRRDGSEVTQGRGTEAMWAAMNTLNDFTFRFLAEIADVRPATAAHYCSLLGKTGFLEVVKPGKGAGKGGVATVWRVAWPHKYKPRAPMITRLKAVYDPNSHQIVWGDSADDAADLVETGGVVE